MTDELQAEGRLDNTLLVFSTDNGMAWGQHRMSLKELPYATHVPLYMAWPARWGSRPRTVDEYTSNIDMAPTFCDAGGCALGPYPTGQSGPDGVSLLPLLDGRVPNLGRDALLETEWRKHPWAAVRTTNLNPLGLWHYVEYQSGFRELYNLAPDADPWEMDNVAYDPDHAGLISQLHVRLIELLAEGRVDTPGRVKVVQDTEPNNAQDFAYSGDFGSFLLDDDSNPTLSRSKVIENVISGTFTIQQAPVDVWRLASISCPPSSVIDVSTGTATVHVQPGQFVVCTFRNTRPQPDAAIAIAPSGTYKGNKVYNVAPADRQTQKLLGVTPGQTYEYDVSVKNRSLDPDSFGLNMTSAGASSMSVAVLDSGGSDMTSALLDGTYITPRLAQGKGIILTVRVTVDSVVFAGNSNTVVLSAHSIAEPLIVDTVRAITTV